MKFLMMEMPEEVKWYIMLFQLYERMSLKTKPALICGTYKSKITISKLFRRGLAILIALDNP